MKTKAFHEGGSTNDIDNSKLKELREMRPGEVLLIMSEAKFIGMYDDKGSRICVGDRLLSKWGYEVIVEEKEGEYYGKLICEPGHSCENIPYALNNGDGYIKK